MTPTLTRILICAATYKRPELLRALLHSLTLQSVLDDPSLHITATILDNDPVQSALPVVQAFPAHPRLPIHYLPVPTPGLTAVRNQAIDLARHDYDYLALLDDDETADPLWLQAFLESHRATGAPILCGRRIPVLAPGGPVWLRSGGFFDEPNYTDLGPMPYGHTANTFLSTHLLRKYPFRFDPALAFSGGEDVLFFAQFLRAGEPIVYAHRAAVTDQIPAERIRPGFLLTRAFRSGGTLLLVDRRLHGRFRPVPARLLRAAAWLAQAALMAARRPWSRAAWLRAGQKAALAAGTLCAVAGYQAQPYAYGRRREEVLGKTALASPAPTQVAPRM